MNNSALPINPSACDLTATTARVVLAPLIASLSNLITTCLQAADTMSGDYSTCFFSPLGLSTHNSTTRSIAQEIRILSSSLKIACHDIVLTGKSTHSDGVGADGNRCDLSEQRLPHNSSNRRNEEERLTSLTFLHRRNQTVVNLFCALAIVQTNFPTESIIQIDVENDEMPPSDNYSAFILSLIQCLDEEYSGTKIRVPSPLRNALFSALDWDIDSANSRNSGTTGDSFGVSCGLKFNERSRLKAAALLKMFRQSAVAMDKTCVGIEVVTDITTVSRRESSGEPILQQQQDRESVNRGASECSAASVDDSQTSLLPVLTRLGTATDDDSENHSSETCDGSSSGMSPLISGTGTGTGNYIDESASPCKSWKERRVSLSKIFTPAHSKSREEKNTESYSPVNEEIDVGKENYAEADADGNHKKNGPFGVNIRSDLFGRSGPIKGGDPVDDCDVHENSNEGKNDDDNENEVTTDICMSVDDDVTSSPHSLCKSNQVLSSNRERRRSLCLSEGHVDLEPELQTEPLTDTDKTLLTAQIAALRSELESAHTENVRLRIARDTIHAERGSLIIQCRTHAADAAGIQKML